MSRTSRWATALGLLLLVAGCGGGDDGGDETPPPPVTPSGYSWSLPKGFPTPKEFAENPMSTAKVELGRHLFYDPRMSINQSASCASCHLPARAFSDGRTTAIGTTGEVHPRNAMSLTNVVYNATFDWANPVLKTLHAQALTPMFAEFPVELGWSDHEAEILDRFRFDPKYQELFAAAYPGESTPVNADRVAKAVAAFVSTLISGNSPYDQATFQLNNSAMSAAARRGQNLFFSERMECFHCHGGFNFSQSVSHAGTPVAQEEFHNNGLYNIGGKGDYPAGNRGLWEFTQRPADMGRFRAPTLRNIELTAPYMHDGSIATLEEVVDHYARGGRLISEGPLAGDGARSPFKSELIVSFRLTAQEKLDLIAFFQSLTDWEFLCDSRFADPFGNSPRHSRCN
ncbi:methanobactin export MATE transporter MbnM [Candidatus Contendibacter odensensis]|uniref:Cytochrome c peroxidase n=1 Tax=Candidatus Contendobacter odensis Run_B_J11 TaxID=1400861 RepID=A0A7U7G7N7_9GAMM|nr:methanobactin export MATE transporter MbnM [Candidatus Contendobacter odensis]CDH43153.1 Cytochrome c peroxidase [Candidatus Contendobacter odensis Run_B_J11]